MSKPKVKDLSPTPKSVPMPTGAGKGDKWRKTNWEAYRASPFWANREKKKQELQTAKPAPHPLIDCQKCGEMLGMDHVCENRDQDGEI